MDAHPPGLISNLSKISPSFLLLLALTLSFLYLSWTFASLNLLHRRTRRLVKGTNAATRVVSWFLDSPAANPTPTRRHRTISFSLIHPVHEFESTSPPIRRTGDVRRSNVDALSDKIVLQELEARDDLNTTNIELARIRLRERFARELGDKLESLGLVLPTAMTDNVSMALRLDLAECLLRRARLTVLNAPWQPCLLSDAELERELDARDVTHELDATNRVLKIHALEVALLQELSPPFAPSLLDDLPRLKILLTDKIKDELAARGQPSPNANSLIDDFELLFSRSDIQAELRCLEQMVGSRRLEF